MFFCSSFQSVCGCVVNDGAVLGSTDISMAKGLPTDHVGIKRSAGSRVAFPNEEKEQLWMPCHISHHE